ncbi:MAG: NAD-dependent epimerase/dehydratase family protein [Actinomycetota bacterium]|nr:NAD-dependent epimerase/dehydratase family protein [Actinomycetota bacterium]
MSPSTVLVTGVSRFIGGHLAARLAADPGISRVLGVDVVPPRRDLLRRMGRTEFIRLDLGNPLIAKVLSRAKVDTVVHAAMTADPRDSGGRRGSIGGRSTVKEMNVVGTMQLLMACQESTTMTRLVVKSTSAVYGTSPRDPAMFTERDESKGLPVSSYGKDAVKVESYIRHFARQRGDVDVTVLRFTNLIGPRIDTVLTQYFTPPVVPTVLGYDGRIQLLHEEDALAVLEQSIRQRLPGVFNVGGDGVLLLSQAIRRAGRIPAPVPEPAMAIVVRLLRGSHLVDYYPEQIRFLNYGQALDTTRLRAEFGFTPRWTTVQAFDDFVHARALRPVIDPKRVAGVERGLRELAARLR